MRSHSLWCGLVLALSLLSPQAFAQSVTINGVPIEAIGAGKAYIQPDGSVIQGIGFKATSPGATQPSYYQRAVQYTKGTVGGNIKQFAKFGAYSIAFSAILEGMGWVLDEITGDIYPNAESAGTPEITCNPRFQASSNLGGSAYGCTPSAAGAQLLLQCNSSMSGSAFAPGYCVLPTVTGVGTFTGGYYFSQRFNSQVNTGTDVYVVQQAQSYTQPAVQGTPASNEQVAEQVAPKLDPDTLDKLATHPQTGAVKQTQEVLDKMTEIANQLAKEADPANTPVSAPTASPTANTTDTPQAAGTNVPAFCVWAKPVCDVIDWVKSPFTPKPEDNTDFTLAAYVDETEVNLESYNSGLGSGSCPSSTSLELLGNSYSFSWQPACTVATSASFLLIAFSYLFSIYILLGIKR